MASGDAVSELGQALATALSLIARLDADLLEIVGLSLWVSLTAVAVFRFPGRGFVAALLNAMMGLPPVVVGLLVYLMLSRSGPFGVFGLLFTPTAMIIAQCVLVTPIIAALARQVVEDLWEEYAEQLRSLGAGPRRAVPTLLWDARFSLITAVLAGFGRAVAEVGAVMIVGGNIDHVTRIMTTAIALETSKGDLVLALALGIVLIALALAVNAAAHVIGGVARAHGK